MGSTGPQYARCLCLHLPDFVVVDMYVREIASELRWEWTSPTDSVPRFVQECIEYMFEREEDPKFPIETLWEGGGDCEDKAILAAALLKALGYDVVFVTYPYYFTGHAMLGVAVPLSKGCYVSLPRQKVLLARRHEQGIQAGTATSRIPR